eukprot:INCI4827.2.p1 GENE.INCI4827.2~~INCI4827.2.p1  ORF type:complete len:291 (-),score=14.41 INCI4827.2:374-1246(-)
MGYSIQLRGAGDVQSDGSDFHTVIFEPAEAYLLHNSAPGFWGAVESSIDWCERNYAVSFYIAEYYNTISNVVLLGLGLWGVALCRKQHFENRFVAVYFGVAAIGLGSAMFHGCLSHVGQQGDETPMIWTILSWLYCLICMEPQYEEAHPRWCKFLAYAFTGIGVAWAIIHYEFSFVLAFQMFFGFITVLALGFLSREYSKCSDEPARRVCRWYVGCLFIAFFFWNIDQQFCEILNSLPYGLPNPQFHAWWHVLVGISSYCGPTFLVFQRTFAISAAFAVVTECRSAFLRR